MSVKDNHALNNSPTFKAVIQKLMSSLESGDISFDEAQEIAQDILYSFRSQSDEDALRYLKTNWNFLNDVEDLSEKNDQRVAEEEDEMEKIKNQLKNLSIDS